MKIAYRPELDGLRAVAVGAVILYHDKIFFRGHKLFEGGFIGVDIFFVISGYLITSIILKELISTDRFSFKYFYERRIRRILPPLIFVLLVSLPFAWMYLLPNNLLEFSKSILYSLGFSSNFYFYFSGQQYGAEGNLNPLITTWSLSIEEQYYILFPLTLLITFKYFRKYLIYVLVLGFFLSLGFAHFTSKTYPSANFYLLHTRIWEFLAGSILAYFEINFGSRNKNKTLNSILPSLGLFLIGYSILFYNDAMLHPSFYTLSPVIGVCLIIWFSQKNDLTTMILSSKMFVGIGLISYSLYLWHYPIFVFDLLPDFENLIYSKKLTYYFIILILSVISFYLIERPAKNYKNKFKFILSIVIISITVLVFYNVNIIKKKAFSNRLPEILNKNLNEKKGPWDMLTNENSKSCYSKITTCYFNTSAKQKVYVIGDSHVGSLTYELKDKLVDKNYQFITVNCMYFPGFTNFKKKPKKISEKCNNNFLQDLKKTLSKEKNSIFIYGGRFPAYFNDMFFDNKEGGIEGKIYAYGYLREGKYKTIQESFKNEVLSLSKNNYIILVYPIPEVGWHVPYRLLNSIKKKRIKDIKEYLIPENYITTSYEVYKNRTKSSFELLDSIKSENIYRVYPHILFCDTIIKKRCVTHDDKDIFYNDNNHLSLKGAEMAVNLVMEEINKIRLKSDLINQKNF